MKPHQTHYTSLLASILFALGSLFLFMVGTVIALSAIINYFDDGFVQAQTTIPFVTLSFLGLLLGIASAVAFLKFLNQSTAETPVSSAFAWWQIVAGMIGAGLAIYSGNFIRGNDSINWFLLPLLVVPGVALPIWTILKLGTKRLEVGSRWRKWSVIGFSLSATPILILSLETAIIIFIVLVVALYVSLNPSLLAEMEHFAVQFRMLDPESTEALQLIAPYLFKPGVIAIALAFFSFIVPLVEEFFKPLAVWILASKLSTRAQGFALGALSGAMFALIETFNVSGQVEDWGSLLVIRIGTGLLHVANSALVGSGIYLMWRERRYLNMLGSYLLAALLHGLWNAAALGYGVASLPGALGLHPDMQNVIHVSAGVMFLLVFVFMFILLSLNHKLQQPTEASIIVETISNE